MKKNFIYTTLTTACMVIVVLMLSGCNDTHGSELSYLAVQLEEGSSWSIIDREGKVVVEEEYPADAVISYIYDGVYWVKTGNKYQLFSIDSPKKPIIDEEFDNVAIFKEYDLTPVSNHNKPICIINTKGKIIATLPKNIKQCQSFSKEGYAIIEDDNGKYGLIDKNGEISVKPTFFDIQPFNDGVALARAKQDDNKITFIDIHGNKLGEIDIKRYLPWGKFSEGKLIAIDANWDSDKYKCHVFNKKGEKLFTIKTSILPCSLYKDGYLVFVNTDWEMGVVDDKGNVVIRPKYQDLFYLGKGEFITKKDDRCGIINAKDEIVMNLEYDDFIREQLGENIIMKDGDEHILLNRKGKELATFSRYTKEGDGFVFYDKQ